MRDAFASEITQLAAEDDRIVLLSGDIGNKMFDPFKKSFPTRFVNCGIAEGNMIGVAAGLALSGLRPVVYTIDSFITFRCYEQIRLDLCYHDVPVILVGVGGGLGYASLGATHHACEDIATLRVLPRMTVICPADPIEVRLATRAAFAVNGPVYMRLGKKGEPNVHTAPPDFQIGRGIRVRAGGKICLLSTGNILPVVMQASDRLAAQGLEPEVVSFHTVKPLDEALLADVFRRFALVASVEEHSILGGLGGSVAEWLTDHPEARARFLRIGTADVFLSEAGEQEHARERFGLTAPGIADKVLARFRALS